MGNTLSTKQKSHRVELYSANLDEFGKSFASVLNLRVKKDSQGYKVLDLSLHELRRIYDENLKNQSIEVLKVNGNYLTTLPKQISNLKNLTKLYLNNNNFKFLPGEIFYLPQLRELNVSYNRLSSLPESIGCSVCLSSLDASYNHLSYLPESLNRLKNLVTLNLENNQFVKIPFPVFNVKSLETLNLSNNKILHLPKNMLHLENLSCLRLSGNTVKTIEEDLVKKGFFNKLKILEINTQCHQNETNIANEGNTNYDRTHKPRKRHSLESKSRPRKYRSGKLLDQRRPTMTTEQREKYHEQSDSVYTFKSYAFSDNCMNQEKVVERL